MQASRSQKATVKLNVDTEENNFMFNENDAIYSDGIGNA